jgi:hypothetical protein
MPFDPQDELVWPYTPNDERKDSQKIIRVETDIYKISRKNKNYMGKR